MRLLLVEDDDSLARSLRRALEVDGFAVDHAPNGADGLWRAREGAYDAIVLDVMLPEINGYEVCRTLRNDGVRTPVLMLTAKSGEYDEADAFDLGADDYLRKPFAHVVLRARLRSLIRRGSRAGGDTLGVDDLVLDPFARTCHRNQHRIELTSREFAVLETLLQRSPNVVPKDEIIESVWGPDFNSDPNIVEVYVSYLRRKIDRPFATNTIATIRGIGYQIAQPACS